MHLIAVPQLSVDFLIDYILGGEGSIEDTSLLPKAPKTSWPFKIETDINYINVI